MSQLNPGSPGPALSRIAPCTAAIAAPFVRRPLLVAAFVVLLACALAPTVLGQSLPPMPRISLGIDAAKNPADVSVTLQVLFMLTILSLAPSILIMMTAFTRIVIVLSILKSALGLPQVPPSQVIVGLSLFLTFFVMRPVFEEVNDKALQPYFKKTIQFPQALEIAQKPLRGFMMRQTYKNDLIFFVNIARLPKPPAVENDIPTIVLIPAFITSELKTAFIMGFYIYLPFLVIDIVVASTLMSMGMMMLPPTMISLPAKILLFVLANGWTVLLGSLARGFNR